jgi:hypothetical protein
MGPERNGNQERECCCGSHMNLTAEYSHARTEMYDEKHHVISHSSHLNTKICYANCFHFWSDRNYSYPAQLLTTSIV